MYIFKFLLQNKTKFPWKWHKMKTTHREGVPPPWWPDCSTLFCNELSSWAAGWFGWCFRMCPLSLSRAVNEDWQLWQRYGRSPVWRNMCRTRELLWRKLKGQCSQKWFFSSAWIYNEVEIKKNKRNIFGSFKYPSVQFFRSPRLQIYLISII